MALDTLITYDSPLPFHFIRSIYLFFFVFHLLLRRSVFVWLYCDWLNSLYIRFSVELELNNLRKTANASALGIPGATHIEDMYYLFRMNLFNPDDHVSNDIELSAPEQQMINMVVKFFTNFVKFG